MTEEFNNISYFHRICVESRLLVLTLMQVFVSRKLQPLTLIELKFLSSPSKFFHTWSMYRTALSETNDQALYLQVKKGGEI